MGIVVRALPYGDSDLILTFFTDVFGIIPAIARGGRATKRQATCLEPFHTLSCELDEKSGSEWMSVRQSRIHNARLRLVADLDRMQSAGMVLRWVRTVCPVRTPEPAVWDQVERLFDQLDASTCAPSCQALTAAAGVRLLGALGWALVLDQCVGCGRTCQSGRPAYIDALRGGLVCRNCGGSRRLLAGPLRDWLLRAQNAPDGVASDLERHDADLVVALVEEALSAHAVQPR